MRYEEACRVADVLSARNPCMQVVLLGRGADMLCDLGLPIPAGTIPAESWLVVAHHAGEDGDTVIGRTGHDAPVLATLNKAGHYVPRQDGRVVKRDGGTLYTWVCPVHAAERRGGSDDGD